MGCGQQALLMGQSGIPLSNLVAWWKADSLVLSDGDAVASWSDSSGNGHTATQSTGANKPTYKASSLNGKPTVYFDNNDQLDFSSAICTGACTVFVVARSIAIQGSDDRPILGVQSSSNDYKLVCDIGGNAPFTVSGVHSSNFRTTLWSQLNVTKAGSGATTVNYRLNRASFGSGTSSGSTSTGCNRIGGSTGNTGWHGQISEIIVYSVVLSAGDITTVETYLETKYAASNTRQLHLEGDAITGKVDGDSISRWVDVSGKANDYITAATFTDAIYKTNLQNSLPGVRFSSSSNRMVPDTTYSNLSMGADDYTIYAVYDYRSGSNTTAQALNGSGGWLIGPYNGTHLNFAGGFSTGLAVTQNVFVIQWVVGSGSANTNNVAGTTYTSGGSNVPGIVALSAGTGGAMIGDICEVIIDSVANTNGATDTTYLALKSKYNL